MKILAFITIGFAFATCLFSQTCAQNDVSTNLTNPIIGDTLSLDERNFYQLFPQIEGFQSAVFYLNPDSTLNADVKYSDDGVLKDTLIKNYRSLKNLNYHIYARDALENGMPERVLNYQAPVYSKGAEVSTYMDDGSETSGELLSVRKNSILLLNPECDDRLLNPDCINQIKASEIDRLVVKGNSNVILGVSLGLLASVVVGAIIYQSNYESSSSWLRGLAAYEKSKTPIILSSIGLITLGATIGIFTSTPDEVINIYSENDIRGLSSYSRYPKEEPKQLKKIQ
ncbi:MAG: hypothetical protein IH618_08185 [Ignavibacteriaceae bacterium]|nr:hypothetical protein [Ignavibacteriaceae bacterium]